VAPEMTTHTAPTENQEIRLVCTFKICPQHSNIGYGLTTKMCFYCLLIIECVLTGELANLKSMVISLSKGQLNNLLKMFNSQFLGMRRKHFIILIDHHTNILFFS